MNNLDEFIEDSLGDKTFFDRYEVEELMKEAVIHALEYSKKIVMKQYLQAESRLDQMNARLEEDFGFSSEDLMNAIKRKKRK